MTRNIFFAGLLLMAISILSSCANKENQDSTTDQSQTIDSLKQVIAQQESPTTAETEDMYAMAFLNMMKIMNELRNNRSKQLAASIESSLPDYLTHMSTFSNSSLKTASFYLADKYYTETKKTPPVELQEHFELARATPQVLSDSCYEEMKCNGGKGCVPWPTSLRAVDITKPNVMGWRYIVGSHCGFAWPKFWKPNCGQPVTGAACTGSH